MESSWTRNWTHVPCIGRQILNHWTTREHGKFLYSTSFSTLGNAWHPWPLSILQRYACVDSYDHVYLWFLSLHLWTMKRKSRENDPSAHTDLPKLWLSLQISHRELPFLSKVYLSDRSICSGWDLYLQELRPSIAWGDTQRYLLINKGLQLLSLDRLNPNVHLSVFRFIQSDISWIPIMVQATHQTLGIQQWTQHPSAGDMLIFPQVLQSLIWKIHQRLQILSTNKVQTLLVSHSLFICLDGWMDEQIKILDIANLSYNYLTAIGS